MGLVAIRSCCECVTSPCLFIEYPWGCTLKKLILLMFILSGCKNIPFEKDFAYMGSAIANSPEYLLTVNGSVCKDTDGFIGACFKRVKSDQNLEFKIFPQQYPYTFILDCTDSINSDFKTNVLNTSEPFTHTIPASKYGANNVFNCTVDIMPLDRPEPISAFAMMRVVVVDSRYVTMDSITSQGRYVVLGRHSYYSDVDGKKFKERTWLKDEDGPISVESYNMRFTYRGY